MPSSIVYTIKGGDAIVFPKSSIKHSRQDEYLGMAPTRHCTDVFFLVAIVLMWSAMSIVGALAIRTGNPFRLVAPMNDQGQLCGPYASSGSTVAVKPLCCPCCDCNSTFNQSLLTPIHSKVSNCPPIHPLNLSYLLYLSFCFSLSVVRHIG